MNEQAASIRVVLADDHPLVRNGIRGVLEQEDIELVGEAADGHEVMIVCRAQQPDVLLLDVNMPGPSAVETVQGVLEECPGTAVLILTAYDDASYVRALVAAGVSGYVLKEEATQEVVDAIRTVARGRDWFSHDVIKGLVSRRITVESQAMPAFSPMELDVLRALGRGMTDAEIASALNCSERTVRRYLSSAGEKLGVTSRVATAVEAAKLGLLDG